MGSALPGSIGADFPCCLENLSRACRHHDPGRIVRCTWRRFPNNVGLPRYYGGSASPLAVSRPARCSLHVTAHTPADFLSEAVSESASDHSSPPDPPPVLPAGTPFAGRDFHPRIPHTFTRRTQRSSRTRHPSPRRGTRQLAVRGGRRRVEDRLHTPERLRQCDAPPAQPVVVSPRRARQLAARSATADVDDLLPDTGARRPLAA